MTERVIIAGFGGQGVMTAGKLLAAVAMREGREVTCISCYGAEVRGGTADCHVVISDDLIHSPSVEEADTLVILNQLSYDKFRPRLREGGLLILNSSMAETDEALERASKVLCLRIPATEAANELGNVRATNVVMMGAYCAARKVLSPDILLAELERELGAGKAHLLEINRKAFQKGQELAEATDDCR